METKSNYFTAETNFPYIWFNGFLRIMYFKGFFKFILCVLFFSQTNNYVSGALTSDMDPTTEAPNEDWNSDFIPSGYLPQYVYRELAWYGLLQHKPLYYSEKYKLVARLIWEHTLGRPHPILKKPELKPSRDQIRRQILAEEGAKWTRVEHTFQDMFVETIKNGGNGITFRTVVSHRNRTTYVIVRGYIYYCPNGGEPDLESYHENLHGPKCKDGSSLVALRYDPCIDAEVTPIEYSRYEGWVFCFGNGERDAFYAENFTVDCGHKDKMSLEDVQDLCTIDYNVVITYRYYGDEPRNDLSTNTSICLSWHPCEVSYLYRLETPPAESIPVFPTTTEDPCDTTVCPECIETLATTKSTTLTLSDDDDDDDVDKTTAAAGVASDASGAPAPDASGAPPAPGGGDAPTTAAPAPADGSESPDAPEASDSPDGEPTTVAPAADDTTPAPER